MCCRIVSNQGRGGSQLHAGLEGAEEGSRQLGGCALEANTRVA